MKRDYAGEPLWVVVSFKYGNPHFVHVVAGKSCKVDYLHNRGTKIVFFLLFQRVKTLSVGRSKRFEEE